MQRRLAGSRSSNGQREPQNNVLEDGDPKNQAGKPGMQDFQVGKDLGDNGNGRHCNAHGKNDRQRKTIAVWTGEGRPDQPWGEEQAEQERHAGADEDEPADFAPLCAGEEVLCLCSGKKHQQKQAQPVDEIDDVALVLRRLEEVRGKGEAAQKGIAQNHSCQNLANDFRLAQPHKEPAEAVSQADKQKEKEEHLR